MSEVEDYTALRRLVDLYSVGVTTRDSTLIGQSFAEDGEWQVLAPMNLARSGRDAIATGIVAGLGAFEFIVQMAHSVHVEIDGDSATLTCVMEEVGRRSTGESMKMLGLYRDKASRGADGWKFQSRTFHPIYIDQTPLPGQAI